MPTEVVGRSKKVAVDETEDDDKVLWNTQEVRSDATDVLAELVNAAVAVEKAPKWPEAGAGENFLSMDVHARFRHSRSVLP